MLAGEDIEREVIVLNFVLKVDSRIDQLEASLLGPPSTSYSDGVFKLEISIPARYPFEPPKVRFITPIYHPNVDTGGRICLDILKLPPHGSWKPSINISSILTSLQVLMAEPNPDDPLMPEVADQFRYHKEKFLAMAKEWTDKHARHQLEKVVPGKRGAESDKEGKRLKT